MHRISGMLLICRALVAQRGPWMRVHTCLLSCGAVLVAGCGDQPRPLARDEQVFFFPTAGYRVPGADDWVIPIHGWVYEASWATEHLGLAARMADLERFLESPAERETLKRRVAPFVADNKQKRRLEIVLGGRRFRLAPAGPDGHIHDELRIPAELAVAASGSGGPPGQQPAVRYRCVCGSPVTQCRLPKRRGSLKRRQRPESRRRS